MAVRGSYFEQLSKHCKYCKYSDSSTGFSLTLKLGYSVVKSDHESGEMSSLL